MPSRFRRPACVIALALLSCSGCYSYNPYGYGASPRPYSTPTPGIMPGPGGFGAPGSGYPSTSPQPSLGEPQEWRGSPNGQPTTPGGESPFFESTPSAPNGTSNGNYVPYPIDPGASIPETTPVPVVRPNNPPFSKPTPVPGSNPGTFDNDEKSPFFDDNGTSLESSDAVEFAAGELDAAPGGIEQAVFEPPVALAPASFKRELVTDATDEGPNPFDCDRQGFRWLRGIVEFDDETQAWHIMYSQKPDPDDAYGGDLPLVDSPELDSLPSGAVVLLEGAVENDPAGKPRYRVKRWSRLIPKK